MKTQHEPGTPDPGVRPDLRIPERRLWAKRARGEVTPVSVVIARMRPAEELPGAVHIDVRIDPIRTSPVLYTRLPYEDELSTVLQLLRRCEAALTGLEREGWSFFREETCQVPYRVGLWLSSLGSGASPVLGNDVELIELLAGVADDEHRPDGYENAPLAGDPATERATGRGSVLSRLAQKLRSAFR